VAVSGYNLTIIIRGTQKGLKRLSRFQILSISLTLIYLFLLITGYSPSIVRAAIVAGLGLLAWYFGRTFRPLLLILLAAVITGFANPYYVWGDIGWYLSFLAFFGVLIVAPLVTIRLFKRKESPLWGSVAIESFAAQIMTLPFIMLIFGRFSLIGFIANIIVVPMVPLAMLLSLIAGLAGMLVPMIAGWIALPARIWLDAMLLIAAGLSKVPGAQSRTSVTVGTFIALYVIIFIVLLGLKKRAVSVTIEPTTADKNEV
jgi:competence protein ComEC